MSPVPTASEGSKPQTNVRIQAKLAIRPEESIRGDSDRLHNTIQVATPVWNKLGGNAGGAGTFYVILSYAGSGQGNKRTDGLKEQSISTGTDRQTDRPTGRQANVMESPCWEATLSDKQPRDGGMG